LVGSSNLSGRANSALLQAVPRAGDVRGVRVVEILLERLNLHRGGQPILRDVSWHVRAGERWLVVGASGAGKTQLLKILSGDVWPDDSSPPARQYRVEGKWHEQPVELRDEIAWLGPERQDRYERYGWNFPAIDVVGTGLHRTDLPLSKLNAAELATCRALLRSAGILRLAARPLLELSYGERRLVLLARALAWRAQVLLLDEAATGLDALNRERLFRLLRSRRLRGTSWVCSAHRSEDIPSGANRLLWMEAGQVRYAGPLTAPRLRAALATTRDESAKPRRRANTVRQSPGTARPAIALRNASVWIDAHRVLRDIDLEIGRGQCWVVHGANGSGKSTLLRTLYGDHPVASGGRIIRAGMGPGVALDRFRARTGLIAPHLQTGYPREYSVLETVVSGLHSSIGLNYGVTPGERRRALAALAAFDLAGFADRRLADISYGQVRRILFARAAVLRPRLLLMDEPFTGLNARVRLPLQAWLEGQIAAGVTVVLATHYRSEWPRNASHELLLSRGRVACAGKL
jgi:molybdate transport system ATP-binding protein